MSKVKIFRKALIYASYYKKQSFVKSRLPKKHIIILETRELGKVCFSTQSNWSIDIKPKTFIDVEVTLNKMGKKMWLAKDAKLIKIHKETCI